MERKGPVLCPDKTEQKVMRLPERVHVSSAPAIFDRLVSSINSTHGDRSELESADTYDIHPAERQTQAVALENRLLTLNNMRVRLGELAATEIIDASLRHAEEFRGLIDFGRLHQK